MRVQRCKGTRDLPPEEMSRFCLIEGVFRDRCLKCGYEEVKTPTLEYLHLFTSTGTLTPNMLGRVYSFLDWNGWSGERVVLRPDGTIPVARLYIDTMAEKKLAKLFCITSVFIFEATGIENTETGGTLARHNLKIIDSLFESTACLIGNAGSANSSVTGQRMKSITETLRTAVVDITTETNQS